MYGALHLLLAAVLVCQEGPPPESAPAGPRGGETTLGDLTAEAKRRAEAARALAAPQLTALLAKLDRTYDARNTEELDRTIAAILALGDASTRPLVEALGEGRESPKAQNAARALAKSPASNVVVELDASLSQGTSREGRARIAWVLGRREGDRSLALLRGLLGDPEVTVVVQAALALGTRKATDSTLAIAEKLGGANPALARPLLLALTQMEDPRAVPAIAAFLETQAAVSCVAAIAEVVRGMRAKELLAPALRVLQRGGAAADEAPELVRAVDTVIQPNDREAAAILKKLVQDNAVRFEVREEAAYALHTAKDPAGKTWLLESVNHAIRDNPEGATLYRTRARIYLRLKLYKESLRDFDEIRRLSSGGRKFALDGDFWIEAARAAAGGKSYQPAADYLRNAMGVGVRPKSFRDLAEFAEMRKIGRYAGLFEGD